MNQHLAGGGITAALTTLVIWLLSLDHTTVTSTEAGGIIVAVTTLAVGILRKLRRKPAATTSG